MLIASHWRWPWLRCLASVCWSSFNRTRSRIFKIFSFSPALAERPKNRRTFRLPGRASSMFSNVVRLSYTRGVWNLRPMPRSAIFASNSFVMSSPSKYTLPVVGRVLPLTRSHSVVLPAPFGPMTTRNSLRFTPQAPMSTALKPSNTALKSSTNNRKSRAPIRLIRGLNSRYSAMSSVVFMLRHRAWPSA